MKEYKKIHHKFSAWSCLVENYLLALNSQEELHVGTKEMNAAVSVCSRSKETECCEGDRLVQGDLLDAHLEKLSSIRRRTENNIVIADSVGVVLDLVLLLL